MAVVLSPKRTGLQIDTLKYLTKGNNNQLSFDGTLLTQCKPANEKVFIILSSVILSMSSKTQKAYAQIFNAINGLLMKHYTTMDTPLITTDAEGALGNAIKVLLNQHLEHDMTWATLVLNIYRVDSTIIKM